MKGKGLFTALHAAASRALSAQSPLRLPNQSIISHTLTRSNGILARSSSPFLHNEHIYHRYAGFSTAAERILDKEESPTPAATELAGLSATTQSQKPRVVVLGTGWGACRLLKDLDTRYYDIVCVSPRNHMVFTPLLASTCVGTLEFRSVAEPVRIIQPALAKDPDSFFFLAQCTDIDTGNREVHCESIYDEATDTAGGEKFKIAYDKLVIATGAEATTFGIQGVYDNAIFLRDVKNAMDIRSKLMLNLMRCEIPGTSLEERKRLLHCVVVGGGPTGVEFRDRKSVV